MACTGVITYEGDNVQESDMYRKVIMYRRVTCTRVTMYRSVITYRRVRIVIHTSSLPEGSGLGVHAHLRLFVPGYGGGLVSLPRGLLVLLRVAVCLLLLLLSSLLLLVALSLLLLPPSRSRLLLLRVGGGALGLAGRGS